MVIPSDLEAARKLQRRVLRSVGRLGYSDGCAFAIRLALEEALSNAIKHGNRMDPQKLVEVSFDIDADRAVLTVTDQGLGFDPASVPDPTADENLEKPTGRGIMLMRAFMDEVCFNQRGNQVRMLKLNR
jgi:serine/threonine-protein kinase RsbW